MHLYVYPTLPPVPDAYFKVVYNNFEIADMEFWRGEAFSAYFDYLDRNGGFYYEVRFTVVTTRCSLISCCLNFFSDWGIACV